MLVNRNAHTLYVGQADARDNGNGILKRMLESHNKKKEIDQWDVGYAMISGTSQFFGATELNCLERFFYDKAVDAGNYTLLNGMKPHSANIGMAMKITLDSYTEHALFLLENVVGCDAFVSDRASIPEGRKKKKDSKVTGSNNTVADNTVSGATTGESVVNSTPTGGVVLYLESKKKDVYAEGVLIDGNKMLVRQGSRISLTSNLPNQIRREVLEKLRQQLITDGTKKDRVFTKDYTFSSSSTAATVILGSSANGAKVWKNSEGKTLGEINAG